ncbi:MAG: nuclear transport factor 2 family protein [Bacteroidota bacterium]
MKYKILNRNQYDHGLPIWASISNIRQDKIKVLTTTISKMYIENMPTRESIESFIKAVEEQPHDQVIESFYTKDASIQENQNTPRIGIENLIENERKMLQKATKVHSECIRPFFCIEDKVVIRWKFRFEWVDGSITEIEEIAYQKWSGEKIHQEQFFYDPKQFIPKKTL